MKRKSALLALVLLIFTTGIHSEVGDSSSFGAEPASYTIVGIIQEAPNPFELNGTPGIIDEAPDPFDRFIVTALIDNSSLFGLVWRPWLSTAVRP